MDPDDNTKPFILQRETAGEEVVIKFKTFDTTVDAKAFDVPEICKQPPK